MKIFLTNKCNLNCVYCFKDKRKKEPELNEIIKNINKAKKEVIFKGGEALVRKEILNLLKYAKLRGLITGIETNGILLNKKILKFVNKIYFVLDTIKFEDWKKITRKSRKDFDKSIKGLRLAKRLGKEIYVDVLLTKLNYNSLRETRNFCKNLRVRLRVIENKSLPGFDYNNSINLPISSAKFLGKEVIYIKKPRKNLLNIKKYRYYKSKVLKKEEKWI